MKPFKPLSLLCVVLFAVSGSAFAATAGRGATTARTSPTTVERGAGGDLGLGVMFGEPTGVSLKKWLTGSTAFDVGLAYSFNNFFDLFADHLWHFPQVFGRKELAPYVGLGGELFFGNTGRSENTGRSTSSVGFGLRVPVGLEFLPRKVPLGVFAEIVPGLALAPGTFGYLDGDIGARFYF